MRFGNFIEGLRILQPYYDDQNGYHIGAEHDQFFAYTTDRPLTVADVKKMHDLGWSQTELWTSDEYDPDKGWTTYV